MRQDITAKERAGLAVVLIIVFSAGVFCGGYNTNYDFSSYITTITAENNNRDETISRGYYDDIYLKCDLKEHIESGWYKLSCTFDSDEYQLCHDESLYGSNYLPELDICIDYFWKAVEVYDINYFAYYPRNGDNKSELIQYMRDYFELSDRLNMIPMTINGELYEK